EAAALWSVVALAKQALGDDVGASMALESALRVAPADEGMTYRQHIAALAQSAARTALARAGNQDTDDRIAELRGALAWTERGLGAVPSDERLSETRALARPDLWPTSEQSVHKLDQRLWWGYTRLGVRRLEAGDYEDAVDPLVRALRLPDVSPDRQSETRAALVRALEGVADLRALSIRQLNDAGDRDGAVLRTETLRELLQSCTELGLSTEELSAVFAQIRRLCEELG